MSIAVVPLFSPRVPVVVISGRFPKSGLILVEESDLVDPLGALPQVQVRDQ
jgi:hypothetical protein